MAQDRIAAWEGPGRGAGAGQITNVGEFEAIARRTPLPVRRMAPGMSSIRPIVSLDREPDVGPGSPWSGGFDGCAFGSAGPLFDPLIGAVLASPLSRVT